MKQHAALDTCPKCGLPMAKGSITCAACATHGRKPTRAAYTIAVCEQCSAEFRLPVWRVKQGKGRFCSRQCVNDYQRTLTGDNSRKYRGGRNTPAYYVGSNWHAARRAVLKRAGGKCEECGVQLVPNSYVIHHRIGIYEFPVPSDGHTPDNLRAWCKSCHAKHHGFGKTPAAKGGDADV